MSAVEARTLEAIPAGAGIASSVRASTALMHAI